MHRSYTRNTFQGLFNTKTSLFPFQVIQDYQLVIVVILLMVVDSSILFTWQILDPIYTTVKTFPRMVRVCFVWAVLHDSICMCCMVFLLKRFAFVCKAVGSRKVELPQCIWRTACNASREAFLVYSHCRDHNYYIANSWNRYTQGLFIIATASSLQNRFWLLLSCWSNGILFYC